MSAIILSVILAIVFACRGEKIEAAILGILAVVFAVVLVCLKARGIV